MGLIFRQQWHDYSDTKNPQDARELKLYTQGDSLVLDSRASEVKLSIDTPAFVREAEFVKLEFNGNIFRMGQFRIYQKHMSTEFFLFS